MPTTGSRNREALVEITCNKLMFGTFVNCYYSMVVFSSIIRELSAEGAKLGRSCLLIMFIIH